MSQQTLGWSYGLVSNSDLEQRTQPLLSEIRLKLRASGDRRQEQVKLPLTQLIIV